MSDAILFPRNPSRPRHRAGALSLIALLAVALCWSMAAGAQEVLLAADFDDKPLNQPIGTGGAALGEPVSVANRIDAVVRDDVMPGKALAISWNETNMSTSSIRFRWLDEVNIRTGVVRISLVITPSHAHQYGVVVRESDRSTKAFGYLYLRIGGYADLTDANTAGDPLPIPDFSWTPGQSYAIEWVFDMGAGTSSLWIDDTLYIEDRAHGVDMGDLGLGALLIAIAGTSDPVQRVDVDDILVTWSGEGIFADGFEADPGLPGAR